MTNNVSNLLKSSQNSLEIPGGITATLPKYDGDIPTLYVFRHGETKDNKRRIFSGRRDSDLTEDGVLQALSLARKMRQLKIDYAYYPPLTRCRKTIKLALKSHRKTKFIVNDKLVERDYGDLSGKSKLQMNKSNPVLTARYRREFNFPPPNGESLKMVWENRIKPFCTEIEKLINDKKINVAVCCTNNTMRLIRMYFEKLTIEEMQQIENPLATDYCSYKII